MVLVKVNPEKPISVSEETLVPLFNTLNKMGLGEGRVVKVTPSGNPKADTLKVLAAFKLLALAAPPAE